MHLSESKVVIVNINACPKSYLYFTFKTLIQLKLKRCFDSQDMFGHRKFNNVFYSRQKDNGPILASVQCPSTKTSVMLNAYHYVGAYKIYSIQIICSNNNLLNNFNVCTITQNLKAQLSQQPINLRCK